MGRFEDDLNKEQDVIHAHQEKLINDLNTMYRQFVKYIDANFDTSQPDVIKAVDAMQLVRHHIKDAVRKEPELYKAPINE